MTFDDLLFIYIWFIIFLIIGLALLRLLYDHTLYESFINRWITKLLRLDKEDSFILFLFERMTIFEEVFKKMLSSPSGKIVLVFIFILNVSIIVCSPEYFAVRVFSAVSVLYISILWERYKRNYLSYDTRRWIFFFESFLFFLFIFISIILYIHLN